MRYWWPAAALVAAATTIVVVAQTTASDGQRIFREDTFGDEQLWTDVLRMHEVVAKLSPAMALKVGLKVDVEALPQNVINDLRADRVNLDDPAVTMLLLRQNAVVGVRGGFSRSGQLESIGVTCALCHSTVDDSLTKGIGRRLDGWAATDLNVGAIVALSPALDTMTKAEFNKWGPGKYDPRHHAFNGANIVPLNSPSLPVVIPPIYGLRGVDFETYTADGPISYWNRYVGVSQMGGQGTFVDQRINLAIQQSPDLVAPKLPALLDYQLSLRTPSPPRGSFDPAAAGRGRGIFNRRLRELPSAAKLYRCRRAIAARHARADRNGDGAGLRVALGDGGVPDDAAAGPVAARAVLSRRQRPRSSGGRRPLRPRPPVEPLGGPEGRPGPVPQVVVRPRRIQSPGATARRTRHLTSGDRIACPAW